MDIPLWFFVLSVAVIAWQGFLLLMALFAPVMRYQVDCFEAPAIESDKFLETLEALTDAQINHHNNLTVVANGERFYEAELNAIRGAVRSINLEAYIFQRGEVSQKFLVALAERARAGVKVNLVLDAIGSFFTSISYCRDLVEAGGRVRFYHPFSWRSIANINNRTHRELLIVDGRVGFIGGAGIADHWLVDKKKRPRWRDTVMRVEGDIVSNLQATFAENWLEASGEIIFGEEYFPGAEHAGNAKAMVINSAPSAGGSTRARILFQALVSAARKNILITTPYFLPDSSMVRELTRAARRGVQIQILLPGKRSDHALTRSSSRRLYGDLLRAGARIYEYRPAMIHAKILVIDDLWSVTGSTNMDNRSFGINDEVNLAVLDQSVAAQLKQDFLADTASSREVTLADWERRSLTERLHEAIGWALQRQQ
ncbi:MAG TPA: phospholipase D-like domain-containing protein [Candidatus Acidoferrales bacterium]|jgi:cardiolipin synthase|nr:phospholipase D-like domain-containing protein [Candidatus Acidoferrales bacterium]